MQLLKIHIVPTFHSLLFPDPIATRSMTEQEAVHQSVQERQLSPSTSSSPATMMWPLLEEYIPINEFTTEGYFSCAFHTLFPTGAEDFSGQRQNQVTIGNYFKHLMMYDDNRFAKHPRFRNRVSTVSEYQNVPNSYLLFTKVSMHLS